MLFFLVSELSQNPLTFFDRLDKLGFREILGLTGQRTRMEDAGTQ